MKYWVSHVVSDNLNDKLDTQVLVLARAVTPDGHFDQSRVLFLPTLENPAQDWSWRVETARGSWGKGSAITAISLFPDGHQYIRGIYSAHARSGAGNPLHVRLRRLSLPSGPARVMVAAPDRVIDEPEHAALRQIIGTLALLSVGLAAATLVQLHVGLRPIRQLSHAIAAVRAGERKLVPDDQPVELRPLALELNALVTQNAEGLAHARRHVANLAHGMKTPLATLALRLAREEASPESRALVADLDQRIAHHLRRARAAAAGVGTRARADLEPVARDLLFAMQHVHDRRGLAFTLDVPSPCPLAVDAEDLDEMVGNLLDNACKWARTRVSLAALAEGSHCAITIADDGPGICEEGLSEAMTPGMRLDESRPGYGFGLSIAQELAQLYGGSLELGRSEHLGGLLARLTLPRPALLHRDG